MGASGRASPLWLANAALLALCGAGCWAIYMVATAPLDGSGGSPVTGQSSARPQDGLAQAAWGPAMPLAELTETTARPAFTKGRRPDPDMVTSVEAARPAAPGDLALTGIVVSETASAALIREPGAARATRVGLGQTVRGWSVAEIGADFVMLSGARGDVRLDLRPDRAPPVPRGPERAAATMATDSGVLVNEEGVILGSATRRAPKRASVAGERAIKGWEP